MAFNLFGKKKEKSTPIEMYMDHLDNIFQMEPEFFVGNQNGHLPGVTSIIYKDIPESSMVTGVTYGLSLVNHREWKKDKRTELMISVNSQDSKWIKAVGFIAEHLRGNCPFCYSNTINFGERIADDSDMDAFLIFAPSILDKEFYLNIDVGLDYQINIGGIYPIYSSEMALVDKWGLEKFWHHPGFDNFRVDRAPIQG